MMKTYIIEAKFFRGLADATRFSVLQTLVDGEKTVGQIVDQAMQSQSNVSNHLKCLMGCGLVKNRRDGKNIHYSLRNSKVKRMINLASQIICEVESDILVCPRYTN